ncbi:MAG: sulfatase [Halanaerobiaceae bacterium]
MEKPNIIYIMSDDHASHAMSCYGSEINETPNIDRIAEEGMKLENCFCTNSICGPSRATILTGKYSHLNGVATHRDKFDNSQQTFPKLMQQNGYQTAMIGKWHLGQGEESQPTGFDYWNVLPGQGDYHNPEMIEMGERKVIEGYVTDIITDLSLNWLDERDEDKPFMLMCHHKAPHRPWRPDEAHADMYEDIDIPLPETFDDDYANRAKAAEAAVMRIDRDLNYGWDLKQLPPERLNKEELKKWKYQQYIKDYLRCIAAVDDNVGRLLDYLDKENLTENTLVVYTSDQGFFLGDHGWFDKRFFYEESLRMPFVVRYPEEIEPGSTANLISLNTDFGPTFLDYAGIEIPEDMQGESLRPVFKGENPENWRQSMYYHYSMYPSVHNVYPHYGIRTRRYKLIYYYLEDCDFEQEDIRFVPPEKAEWEFFDLKKDPNELNNQYNNPEYKEIIAELKKELYKLKYDFKDFTAN